MSSAIVMYPIYFPTVSSAISAFSTVTSGTAVATSYTISTAAGTAGGAAVGTAIGTGLLSIAGAAATMIIAPIVINTVLDKIASTLSMSEGRELEICSARLKECSDQLQKEIDQALQLYAERVKKTAITEKSRKSLENDLHALDDLAAQIVAKISNGSFVKQDASKWRTALDKLSDNLRFHESEDAQINNLFQYYDDKTRKALETLQKMGAADEAKIKNWRAAREATLKMPAEQIEKKLEAISDLSAELNSALSNTAEEEKAENIKNEIEFFLTRLKKEAPRLLSNDIDELCTRAEKSGFTEKLIALKDEIKLTYQKFREEQSQNDFFHNKLHAWQAVFAPTTPLGGRIFEALNTDSISRPKFRKISLEIEKFLAESIDRKKHAFIQEKIKTGLVKLDYLVLDPSVEETIAERLSKQEIVSLDTKYEDYKVLLRIDADENVAVRLIRIVESEKEKEEITEYQKQKDREIMSEWCKGFNCFAQDLRKNGVLMVEAVRIEDKVDYMTIEQLEQSKINIGIQKKSDKKTSTERKKQGKAETRFPE